MKMETPELDNARLRGIFAGLKPAPCDGCPLAARCAAERLACEAFYSYVSELTPVPPGNPTRELHDAIYSDDEIEARRVLRSTRTKVRFKKKQQKVTMEGETFASGARLATAARKRGYTGSNETIYARLKRGATTWAELLKPCSPGRKSVEPVRYAFDDKHLTVAEILRELPHLSQSSVRYRINAGLNTREAFMAFGRAA